MYIVGAVQRRLARFCENNSVCIVLICIPCRPYQYHLQSRVQNFQIFGDLLSKGLTFQEGVAEYGEDVLIKIIQREVVPGALIIPARKITIVFLRIEGIICSIMQSPKHFAVLAGSAWQVLKTAIAAYEPESEIIEWLSSVYCDAAQTAESPDED